MFYSCTTPLIETFRGKNGTHTIRSAKIASKDLILMLVIITAIETCGTLREDIKIIQEDLSENSLALVYECNTCWEGLFQAVSCFEKLQESITMVVTENHGHWYTSLIKDLSVSCPGNRAHTYKNGLTSYILH